MNFDLNEEQQLLAESVRRFAAQDYTFEARRAAIASPEGYSAAAWDAMASIGLLALPLPTEHGGFGGKAVDLMPVMETIGEALVVEPYLSTLLAARLVARAGTAEQQEALLPRVAEGKRRLAVAHVEAQGGHTLSHVATRAQRAGSGHVLNGEKRVVLHAPLADALVVPARLSGATADEAGIGLFLVEAAAPGVSMTAYTTLDGLRAADVRFGDAAATLLGEGDAFAAFEEAIDYATALVCAEAVGAIRSANQATLEYLKTRRQFGMPIGAFQALQHRMVDMYISYEQAKSMASLACARVDADGITPSERRRVVSAAKLRIADACRHVSQESVQLHGGMGMTDELKVSHTFRRLTMLARQFGDADHHLARFAEPDRSR